MNDGGGGTKENRPTNADLAALPEHIAKQSLARGSVILPRDAALEAITILTAQGRRLENWEGWVKLREGGRAKSLTYGGSFALPREAPRAAEVARAAIERASERWTRSPEYEGGELYFGLGFGES